jgi:rubrerythrin
MPLKRVIARARKNTKQAASGKFPAKKKPARKSSPRRAEPNAVAKHLISLVHLDIDAIHAYETAMEQIDIVEVRETLHAFRLDHVQHVKDLNPLIKQNGGKMPEFKRDMKGVMIQGITALRSATGTAGALKAMRLNEELTNVTYERALHWTIPKYVRKVVQKNRDDEARHLKYIERVIRAKVWEENRKLAA